MDIITTARRFEMTPEIREHVRKRMEKLERYFTGLAEVHLVLATEKYRQIAEVTLNAKGTEIVSREQSDDMQTSIDRVVERLERQLKRQRGRQTDRKARRGAPPVPSESGVEEVSGAEGAGEAEGDFAVEEQLEPVVIREEGHVGERLTVEEAIERMHAEERDFLLFTSARSDRVTLVYLRADGAYGLQEAS